MRRTATNYRALRRLPLAAALAAAACAGSGTNTGPTAAAAPPALGSIRVWSGSANFSESTTRPSGSFAVTYEGSVTFQKEDNPDPTVPLRAGALRYRVASGQMHLAYRGTQTFTVPTVVACTYSGDAEVALGPNDTPGDPFLASWLDVGQDSQYTGVIYRKAPLVVAMTCNDGTDRRIPDEQTMALQIRGTVIDGRRLQGNMVPETIGGGTRTGAWDFSAR